MPMAISQAIRTNKTSLIFPPPDFMFSAKFCQSINNSRKHNQQINSQQQVKWRYFPFINLHIMFH
jgi:hypothetical protein